jgi:hypothetical protein
MSETDVDETVQKGSGRKDQGLCRKRFAKVGFHAGDPVAFNQNFLNRGLFDQEVFLILHSLFHPKAVMLSVHLGPGGANGWPFGGIELAELNPGFICCHGHLATEGIDLFDEMALGKPTDSGIAGHITHLIDVLCDEKGRVPHSS